jgi:hypothetical protein
LIICRYRFKNYIFGLEAAVAKDDEAVRMERRGLSTKRLIVHAIKPANSI